MYSPIIFDSIRALILPHHPATFHLSHHPNILAAMPPTPPPPVICPKKPLHAFEDTTSYQGLGGSHRVVPFDERAQALKITSLCTCCSSRRTSLSSLSLVCGCLILVGISFIPSDLTCHLNLLYHSVLAIASSVYTKLASIVHDQLSHW